jgi:cell division protein FtsA
MKDYFIGIDVGSSKVCAALGKVDNYGSFQVVGVTSLRCSALSKAVVVDIDAAAEVIKECINKLEAVTHSPIKNVILGFPGGLCDLSNSKGIISIDSEDCKITEKDVEKVQDTAKNISISDDKEIIGVIPKNYTIDNNIKVSNPMGMKSTKLELDGDIVLADSRPIVNLLLSMERAGIVPDEVMIQPVAQKALLLKNELDSCTALVDVGADVVDFSIYKGGNICYTNLIPLGGSNITNDISKCLDISLTDAEKIKIKYGDVFIEHRDEEIKIESSYGEVKSLSRATLTDIISARVEEILSFILAEMKLSGYYNDIEVVVITGGGISMFEHISTLSTSILHKSVRMVVPDIDEISNTTNTTAISIVKNKINFFSTSNNISRNESTKKSEESKKIKEKKFGWKIRELLDEFF